MIKYLKGSKIWKNLEDNSIYSSLDNVTKTIKENFGKVLGGLSFAYIGYKLGSEFKKESRMQ